MYRTIDADTRSYRQAAAVAAQSGRRALVLLAPYSVSSSVGTDSLPFGA